MREAASPVLCSHTSHPFQVRIYAVLSRSTQDVFRGAIDCVGIYCLDSF